MAASLARFCCCYSKNRNCFLRIEYYI